MNRRKFLMGSAASVVVSALPSQASSELFEPLYARLTPEPSSFLYNMPTALYRISQGKTIFYGRIKTDWATFNFWWPYDRNKISMAAFLPDTVTEEMVKYNEAEYNKLGMIVAEMPHKVRETHERILGYNKEIFSGNASALPLPEPPK